MGYQLSKLILASTVIAATAGCGVDHQCYSQTSPDGKFRVEIFNHYSSRFSAAIAQANEGPTDTSQCFNEPVVLRVVDASGNELHRHEFKYISDAKNFQWEPGAVVVEYGRRVRLER